MQAPTPTPLTTVYLTLFVLQEHPQEGDVLGAGGREGVCPAWDVETQSGVSWLGSRWGAGGVSSTELGMNGQTLGSVSLSSGPSHWEVGR